MLVVFSSAITSRLNYTLKLIFNDVLGIEYRVTSNPEEFKNSTDTKINYSSVQFTNCTNIQPKGLLFESSIQKHEIDIGNWEGLTTLYANDNMEIPFDLFSAAFYLATRYEEYLPFEADVHGRFEATESIAYREGFLKLPIIDLWSKKLADILGIYKLCSNIQPNNYRFQLSVDIDQPWSYKNKGAYYVMGSLVREILRLNCKGFFNRLATLLRLKPDPADTYAYLSSIQERLQLPILYFIHCQNKGRFDKNSSLYHQLFPRLIQQLDSNDNVGIHPSYSSNGNDDYLLNEINFLANILQRKVTISRQHYLKLGFPATFQKLISHGIFADYSLGYGQSTGFRSGLARSNFFFDLQKNEETKLRLTPLHVMDRTLLDYQQNTPEEAIGEFGYFSELVRSIGGELACLWHNESLSDHGEWKGWKKVFEEMIELNEKQ